MLPQSLAMFSQAGRLMVLSASVLAGEPKKKTAGFENNERIMGHEISYNAGEMEQENR